MHLTSHQSRKSYASAAIRQNGVILEMVIFRFINNIDLLIEQSQVVYSGSVVVRSRIKDYSTVRRRVWPKVSRSLRECHVSSPTVLGFILRSLSSYRLRSSLSIQPPFGNGFSHWLCRCTEKTFPSTRSSPPPSSRLMPSVHFPFEGSDTNGSGSRLSKRHDRPSEKQKGRTLKGGIDASRRRRHSLR